MLSLIDRHFYHNIESLDQKFSLFKQNYFLGNWSAFPLEDLKTIFKFLAVCLLFIAFPIYLLSSIYLFICTFIKKSCQKKQKKNFYTF